MVNCVVCNKECDEKNIEKGGKTFCCADCLKQFEDEHKSDTKNNVCEFC